MHKFVRNLITEWRRLELPFTSATVIVAVSGGADSTALLLALADLKKRKKIDLEIIVAHFNHKLRGRDSDADERFVHDLAAERGFEFVCGRGSIKGPSDLEQRARNARYKFLSKLAKRKKAGYVLTAHTLNDQAETVLMNIIRGSGSDGLSGMRPIRTLEEEKRRKGEKEREILNHKSPHLLFSSSPLLARPLLTWAKRDETEQFCAEIDVPFRNDSMNDDLRFTRVKIRKQVLPLLAEINPKIVESLARLAGLSIGSATSTKSPNEASVALTELSGLSNIDLNTQIRAWLSQNRGNSRGLQLKHIEAVARLVKSRKSGRVVELPGGDSVVKSGGRLAFRHIKLEY